VYDFEMVIIMLKPFLTRK